MGFRYEYDRDVGKSMMGDLQVMMMGWFRGMIWGVREVSCGPKVSQGFWFRGGGGWMSLIEVSGLRLVFSLLDML
jgi:hypothetical protein